MRNPLIAEKISEDQYSVRRGDSVMILTAAQYHELCEVVTAMDQQGEISIIEIVKAST